MSLQTNPESQALAACDACRTQRAQRLALLTLETATSRTSPLPEALRHLSPIVDARLEAAAAAACASQWQRAALEARDANDALANAILQAYPDPDSTAAAGTVLMPLTAARAFEILSAATMTLVALSLCDEDPGSAWETLNSAITIPLALLLQRLEQRQQALDIASDQCRHPGRHANARRLLS